MGRTHLAAWSSAGHDGLPCRVVAVSDRNPQALTGEAPAGATGNLDAHGKPARLFDPAVVRTFLDVDELLADRGVDVVSICTHTDTHVDLACAALRAGKHVLLEKPVSITADGARRVAEAASAAGKVCMVAMCMRFWPAWAWLKRAIDSGEHGALSSVSFARLASPPGWSREFYLAAEKSGGALVDLHIHDTDFVRYCFGEPTGVITTGSLHQLTTIYRVASCAHVVAHGGWDFAQGFPFRMRYLANFRDGTADFDITRTPQLLWHAGGKSEAVDVGTRTGYDEQVRHLTMHLIGHLTGQRDGQAGAGTPLLADIRDAVKTHALLDAERVSLEEKREVAPGDRR